MKLQVDLWMGLSSSLSLTCLRVHQARHTTIQFTTTAMMLAVAMQDAMTMKNRPTTTRGGFSVAAVVSESKQSL